MFTIKKMGHITECDYCEAPILEDDTAYADSPECNVIACSPQCLRSMPDTELVLGVVPFERKQKWDDDD